MIISDHILSLGLNFESVRGNLNTRLKKLDTSTDDGTLSTHARDDVCSSTLLVTGILWKEEAAPPPASPRD